MQATVIHGLGSVKYHTVENPKLKEQDVVILKLTSMVI